MGNSDPGTSGTLSPFSKDIKGLYFNDDPEPDNFIGEFRNSVQEILDEEGAEYISIKFDDPQDYYNILNELHQFTENNIKVSCTSLTDEYEVILEEENLDVQETV